MKKLFQLLIDNAAKERKPLVVMQAAEGAAAEVVLFMYGIIYADWDISAMDVAKALASLDPKSTVRMRVNSPGGDVFEAKAIVTAMQDFRNGGGKIIAQIDALAASCMSWIVLAADEVEIAPGAFMMIHNAMAGCYGSAADLTATAALLNKIESSIVAEYVAETGKTAAEIQAWMNAETWFDAQEAVDAGFADRVIAQVSDKPANVAAPKWNLAAYEKAPQALLTPPAELPANEPDFEAVRAHNERRLQLFQFA
jgi:ATP-dependent Clp protease, protease subunit